MNWKTIWFFFWLAIFTLILTVSTTYIISGIIGLIRQSILGISFIIIGILLLILSLIIMIFLDIMILPPYSKDRNYPKERKTMALFALATWIVVLSLGTALIYISLNFLTHLFPGVNEILGEYMFLIYPAAIGALWGIGMSEAMHVGSLTMYGKKYQENIYWAKEIEGGKDWYPDRKSFDENLHYWKKILIPLSAILCLVVFILIPKFYELFNYLSSIQ